jgi:hypothetical protein
MKVPRWVTQTSFLCALLAGIGGLAWLGRQAVWSPGNPEGDLDTKNRELEARTRLVSQRIERKQELACEVARGKMTLLQAAAWMQKLNQSPPEFHWEWFRKWHAGRTDEERHCREAIDWVMIALEGDSKQQVVLERLEKELAEALRRGPVRLPSVEPQHVALPSTDVKKIEVKPVD